MELEGYLTNVCCPAVINQRPSRLTRDLVVDETASLTWCSRRRARQELSLSPSLEILLTKNLKASEPIRE